MNKHLPALDGIRGVAILLVLFAHLVPYSPSPFLAYRILNGAVGVGWSGVSLFFVLSGFLITGLLYEAKQRPHYFRNFYARRTLRISPLYFLLLILCMILLPRFFGLTASRPVADRWMYWCYLSNLHDSFRGGVSDGWIGQLWSLTVEEHFYLLWPIIIAMCSRVVAMRVCVACMLSANLCRIWFVAHGNLQAPYYFTFCRMDDLAIGSLLALALKSRSDITWIRGTAIRVVAMVTPLIIILTVWKHGVIFAPALLLAGLPLVSILFACLLAVAIFPGSQGWAALLSVKPLRSFGKYSFGLYMYHPAVGALMMHFSLLPKGQSRADDLLRAGILIASSFLVAFVSYHLFEQHFLKLKRYFESEARTSGIPRTDDIAHAASRYDSAFQVPSA